MNELRHRWMVPVDSSSILPLLRVLVIEDDTNMRTLLCRTMKGFKVGSVVGAASVEESLPIIEASASKINFVLCDWNLPGISGFDFCRTLKAHKPALLILMITGRTDIASITTARHAGIDGYLIKPVTPAELLKKITSIVRQNWAPPTPNGLLRPSA